MREKIYNTCIVQCKNDNWEVRKLKFLYKMYQILYVKSHLTPVMNKMVLYENYDRQNKAPGVSPVIPRIKSKCINGHTGDIFQFYTLILKDLVTAMNRDYTRRYI